jgi:hypothetical protein
VIVILWPTLGETEPSNKNFNHRKEVKMEDQITVKPEAKRGRGRPRIHPVKAQMPVILQGKSHGLLNQTMTFAIGATEGANFSYCETLIKLMFSEDPKYHTVSRGVILRRALSCYRQHLQSLVIENRKDPVSFELALQREKDELVQASGR